MQGRSRECLFGSGGDWRARAGYAADAKASATRRAYAADFRAFEAWCEGHGASSLPATPSTVCVYLAEIGRAHV